MDEILTQEEAASYSKISSRLLIKLVRRGTIPAVEIGGLIMFHKEQLSESLKLLAAEQQESRKKAFKKKLESRLELEKESNISTKPKNRRKPLIPVVRQKRLPQVGKDC